MAEALAAHHGKLCVIVGKANADVLALGGHETANQAQCVVSTHAALKESLKASGTFDHAQRFHYRGARRAVVAWDEAIAFNRPVVLDGDAVDGHRRAGDVDRHHGGGGRGVGLGVRVHGWVCSSSRLRRPR